MWGGHPGRVWVFSYAEQGQLSKKNTTDSSSSSSTAPHKVTTKRPSPRKLHHSLKTSLLSSLFLLHELWIAPKPFPFLSSWARHQEQPYSTSHFFFKRDQKFFLKETPKLNAASNWLVPKANLRHFSRRGGGGELKMKRNGEEFHVFFFPDGRSKGLPGEERKIIWLNAQTETQPATHS